MRLKVKPFRLTLEVDTVDVNPTGIIINEGVPQNLVTIQILASKHVKQEIIPETTDDEGNVIPEHEGGVPTLMSSPYKLDNPTSVPFVPMEFVSGLVQAAANPEILPIINAQIEAAGYNAMFQGSLEGFKLEIEEVII